MIVPALTTAAVTVTVTGLTAEQARDRPSIGPTSAGRAILTGPAVAQHHGQTKESVPVH
jgi:hypothetical protein